MEWDGGRSGDREHGAAAVKASKHATRSVRATRKNPHIEMRTPDFEALTLVDPSYLMCRKKLDRKVCRAEPRVIV